MGFENEYELYVDGISLGRVQDMKVTLDTENITDNIKRIPIRERLEIITDRYDWHSMPQEGNDMKIVWKKFTRSPLFGDIFNGSIEVESDKNSDFALKLLNLTGFLKIKKLHMNNPATVIEWEDGTKTVVKCGDEDEYDVEKGLAMCFMKKLLGNEGNYYDKFMMMIDPDFKVKRRKEKNDKRREKQKEKARREERIKNIIAENTTTSYEAYDLKHKNKNEEE